MTKKQSDMTPDEIARVKEKALAWRQANRKRINDAQNEKRAAARALRPQPTEDEIKQQRLDRAAHAAAYKKQWRLDNIERISHERKERYSVSREESIRKAVEWARKNQEKRRAISKRYSDANPEVRRAVKANRRARERAGKLDRKATKDIVLFLLRMQKRRCAACAQRLTEKYELDHIVALSAGGGNDRTNFQLLCRPCNRSKGAKHPVEFMQSRGRLL